MSDLDTALLTALITSVITAVITGFLIRRRDRRRGMYGEHNDPDRGTKTDVSVDL